MTSPTRRVAIVEDHGALRIFLRDVLTHLGWSVTGVAGTAESGRELVLKAGADGIVLKEGGLPELVAGIEAVTRGEQYLSPSLSGGN